jgi:hypothetical protein
MNVDTIYYGLCIIGVILIISGFFILTKENGLIPRIGEIAILVDPLNKEEIINKMIFLKYTEEFTKKEILKDLNFFLKEYNSTKYPILIGCSNNEYKNIWASFFKINEEWSYIMKNVTNQDKKIKIYKNSYPNIIEFTLFSGGNWRILPIKNINDNDFFDVYINGNLFKKYNLKSDMLEFKDNFIKPL